MRSLSGAGRVNRANTFSECVARANFSRVSPPSQPTFTTHLGPGGCSKSTPPPRLHSMLANALLPAQGRRQLERGLGAAGPRESQRAERQGLPGGGVSAARAGAGRSPARRRSAGWGEGCPRGGRRVPRRGAEVALQSPRAWPRTPSRAAEMRRGAGVALLASVLWVAARCQQRGEPGSPSLCGRDGCGTKP